MLENKYAATIKECRQYSEDDYEGVVRVKDVDRNTTIGELIDWQLGKDGVKLLGIQFIPIQIIKKEA